ncbi:ovarian cancer-associated gene 2 protein [Seminavis robusta]|uniref:Ovarian cancer-associated gene 2 protein n=1 Tax=Seminavis robusta TaxID=568900 RepID=A0A9N8H9L5_9STRA|nr:ovarian cancer-associated gene 2 protein [Seminavis robusta]|eukprot:Sro196_g083400.1 ovarian cancer-associated gene 2 protein (232) ;mRNA; f:16787-17482
MQATQDDEQGDDNCQVLRVLALHGSGGSADEFTSRLENYRLALKEDYHTELQVVAMDAPFPKEGGYSWWTMPPGERSFNAMEYLGFDKSAELVSSAIFQEQPATFDIIYAHSQGAILTAALLALQRFPEHPTRGYILNGVAWPNPYSEQLESVSFVNDQTNNETKPRILICTGENDRINPPDTQQRVKVALEQAGARVEQISHPGGHSIPVQRDETLDKLLGWIMQPQPQS